MSALAGFHHVKLPVSNVERSRAWYQLVLDLVPHIDFVEGGVLMGVPMRSADGSLVLALRGDSVRAAALAGFDAFALGTHPLGAAEVAGSVGQARRAAQRHRCGPYRLGDRRGP
jgi:catechol 2,3-dioxygenase-like lactoylglutathione lyase family enzyme